MATPAQVNANRRNAKKATGPRTAEGKEKASQNAVKHGLFAREGVIRGEDWEEYEIHREMLMDHLRPEGPLEVILASRAVDLTWRLRRAAQDRNEAFGALYDRHTAGGPEPQDAGDRGATLGRMVLNDFLEDAVLERLQRYERRIESSLYRTLNELRRIHDPSRKPDREVAATLARWREEDWEAKKAWAFGRQAPVEAPATATPHGVSTNELCETKPNEGSVKCEVSSFKKENGQAGPDLTLETSHFTPPEETPDGVTTNECAKRTQFGGPGLDEQDASRASGPRIQGKPATALVSTGLSPVALVAVPGPASTRISELCKTKPNLEKMGCLGEEAISGQGRGEVADCPTVGGETTCRTKPKLAGAGSWPEAGGSRNDERSSAKQSQILE
jgi:hypothetical protein